MDQLDDVIKEMQWWMRIKPDLPSVCGRAIEAMNKQKELLVKKQHDVDKMCVEASRLRHLINDKPPKKVKDFQYLADLFVGKCPSCGEELNNEVYPAFCGFCGQRISWKDGEQE